VKKNQSITTFLIVFLLSSFYVSLVQIVYATGQNLSFTISNTATSSSLQSYGGKESLNKRSDASRSSSTSSYKGKERLFTTSVTVTTASTSSRSINIVRRVSDASLSATSRISKIEKSLNKQTDTTVSSSTSTYKGKESLFPTSVTATVASTSSRSIEIKRPFSDTSQVVMTIISSVGNAFSKFDSSLTSSSPAYNGKESLFTFAPWNFVSSTPNYKGKESLFTAISDRAKVADQLVRSIEVSGFFSDIADAASSIGAGIEKAFKFTASQPISDFSTIGQEKLFNNVFANTMSGAGSYLGKESNIIASDTTTAANSFIRGVENFFTINLWNFIQNVWQGIEEVVMHPPSPTPSSTPLPTNGPSSNNGDTLPSPSPQPTKPAANMWAYCFVAVVVVLLVGVLIYDKDIKIHIKTIPPLEEE
jgi:hypothetical protein